MHTGYAVSAAEIRFIRETFQLRPRDLAKALNVAPNTAMRWESPENRNQPTGLQEEVLRALHNVAIRVQNNEAERRIVSGLIALGIGALIFYLLTQTRA